MISRSRSRPGHALRVSGNRLDARIGTRKIDALKYVPLENHPARNAEQNDAAVRRCGKQQSAIDSHRRRSGPCVDFLFEECIRMSQIMVSRRFAMARTAQVLFGGAAVALFAPAALARVTIKAVEPGLALTSAALADGKTIPARYTCDGANVSPPLSWSGIPEGTKSFALVCYDPDAPRGVFHHWAIFDLPGDRDALREGIAKGAQTEDGRQAVNDFGEAGYRGPCPPPGHRLHHYHFDLFALPIPRLDLPPDAACRDVLTAARKTALGTATLIGLYSR